MAARHLAAGLAGATVLALAAGCAAGSGRNVTAQAPASPVAAPCAALHCAAGDSEAMADGYAARLWSSPPPATGDRSVPVVELLHDNAHLAWWVGQLGSGWSATLTCDSNGCVVIAGLGAHGGVAQSLLRAGSGFSAPPAAAVEFDTGLPLTRDLDHDGWLDVIGMENDYRPNFAQGHNYWATYRLTGRQLVRTGCTPAATHPLPPDALLTGACPVLPRQ